jgi:AcrR family transcriptional regulator
MSGQGQRRRLRADAERNRARLLDAARAAFAAGQVPVTLEQIAKDADVGIGTLYRHFPTREALVEALYRRELADLCASAGDLLAVYTPERAMRAWMDRFADYVCAKREMADTLRIVLASGAVAVSQAREQLTAAVTTILDAGVAAGTLRADVRPEDVVATIVGMFTATSLDGGREQLERMFDLLMDAIQRVGGQTDIRKGGDALWASLFHTACGPEPPLSAANTPPTPRPMPRPMCAGCVTPARTGRVGSAMSRPL